MLRRPAPLVSLALQALLAAPAVADDLPRPVSIGDLATLAARVDASSVDVVTTLAPPKGTWAPAPTLVRGAAVLLGRGEALALVTALPVVAGAGAIQLERADGTTSVATVGRSSPHHGLATLIPRDPRFLAALSAVVVAPRNRDLRSAPERVRVWVRDRWPAPEDAAPSGRPAVRAALGLGPGRGPEAYFTRVGLIPVPGDPVVDREGRLLAVGHGPSLLDGGDVGLAVGWTFVEEFLDDFLGWPVAQRDAKTP